MSQSENYSHVTLKKRMYSTVKHVFTSIKPRKVVLVCDATYFGKRSEKTSLDGLLVFLDSITGQILWFKFLENETNLDYQEGLNYLEIRGFEIAGVVTDGRRGLPKIFAKYPYQICQFHIQKGARTLLTRNPKSEAGKELFVLNTSFIKDKVSQEQFSFELKNLTQKHKEYLEEKSETDSRTYKHQRLRKPLNKLKSNTKHLFTFQEYPQIPNTTNHIDGGLFSPLKRLLNNHTGLSKQHRTILITYFLNSRGKFE